MAPKKAPTEIGYAEFYGGLERAGDGARTRDPELGKLVLYQLSYSRMRPS